MLFLYNEIQVRCVDWKSFRRPCKGCTCRCRKVFFEFRCFDNLFVLVSVESEILSKITKMLWFWSIDSSSEKWFISCFYMHIVSWKWAIFSSWWHHKSSILFVDRISLLDSPCITINTEEAVFGSKSLETIIDFACLCKAALTYVFELCMNFIIQWSYKCKKIPRVVLFDRGQKGECRWVKFHTCILDFYRCFARYLECVLI